MNENCLNVSCLEELMNKEGYKLTEQRLGIVNTIYKNKEHMCAYEIYKNLENKGIGLATIYRNLIILEEVGILKKINIAEVNYYEVEKLSEDKLHIHMKCSKCSSVMDIDEKDFSDEYLSMIKKFKKKYKINLKSTSIVVSAICKKCK